MNATESLNGTLTTTHVINASPSWGMVTLQGTLTVAAWAALGVQLAVILPAVQGRHDLDGERERLRLVREQEETLQRIRAKSATILAIQERHERLLKTKESRNGE